MLLSEIFLINSTRPGEFCICQKASNDFITDMTQNSDSLVISFACVAGTRNLLYRLHYTGASNDSMFGEAKLTYNLLYLEEG